MGSAMQPSQTNQASLGNQGNQPTKPIRSDLTKAKAKADPNQLSQPTRTNPNQPEPKRQKTSQNRKNPIFISR